MVSLEPRRDEDHLGERRHMTLGESTCIMTTSKRYFRCPPRRMLTHQSYSRFTLRCLLARYAAATMKGCGACMKTSVYGWRHGSGSKFGQSPQLSQLIYLNRQRHRPAIVLCGTSCGTCSASCGARGDSCQRASGHWRNRSARQQYRGSSLTRPATRSPAEIARVECAP